MVYQQVADTEAPSSSLSAQAYAELKALIVGGRFAPDEALSERGLAEAIGIGRMPVREAIKLLEREGVLLVVPRHGIFVKRLSAAEVSELYVARQALEGMAARVCTVRGQRAEMAGERARLERHLASRIVDLAQVQRDNARFHRRMFELAGNDRLREMYTLIEPQIDLNLRFTAVHAPERIEAALREHLEICRAIESGDALRAEQLTREHLEAGLQARLAILAGAAGGTKSR
jgi:DNA-binding GntR family transcriptional regulator